VHLILIQDLIKQNLTMVLHGQVNLIHLMQLLVLVVLELKLLLLELEDSLEVVE